MAKPKSEPMKLKGIGELGLFKNPVETNEKVELLKLDTLHFFNNHPFKVVDDDSLKDMTQSIQEHGVMTPLIVRLKDEGGYEIVSGHRRFTASKLAGRTDIPCIIRDLTDDEAIILMVDANLQRETILPSERAFAYRMKLEAMKRQAGRPPKNSTQVVQDYSVEKLGNEMGMSRENIRRYIRLTYLIPPLLDKIDNDPAFSFNSAVSVSYLNELEQYDLWEYMQQEEVIPSVKQGYMLKEISQKEEQGLTPESIAVIMHDEKDFNRRIVINDSELKKYFPENFDRKEINAIIINLLDEWSKSQDVKPRSIKKQDEQER